ncbi:biotin--[acetyl-CoA-carboxylase] ligase [Sphingobacterium sp. UT-1RO-CII-1]|uniref:biotin--[acetyl-CoA-carboxylase] ligase n=1 Tax=Sphingobacterium sp. UT-1RO-CII-1 TaxID=2995225 RepID=UPI00227A6EE3|nr:biotin--[acetyl-CoA-carboxylase] ligase [Sphingobacterium sp. UT-1RO-CII-1]MCY4780861.1 biotin--[acetyl-CoA-carboxylase] ligase [Sphingobacterium sp. UT-1RO-CII-1]
MNGIYFLNHYHLQNSTIYGLYPRESIIILEELSSTNDYLKLLLSNIKPLYQGTAIMAMHQTRGKGQRGNKWRSTPNENLMCSIPLFPKNIGIEKAFNLSILISLATHSWLSKYVSNVQVKWPNDIYVGNKKIAGILIENQLIGTRIRSCIIGIGVNINQTVFSPEMENKTTSLKLLTGCEKNYNLVSCCKELQTEIMLFYQYLDLTLDEVLLDKYNALLYRKNKSAFYKVQGEIKEGTIIRVAPNGQLIIKFGQQKATFDLKEVQFL